MAQTTETGIGSETNLNLVSGSMTAVDLVERFGPIPLWRIRREPAPGTAVEEDVTSIHDHEGKLCELVDGILVEKTVGSYESLLAATLIRLVGNFVADRDLGVILGADGMLRLAPDLVRIPDVSFISWARIPGRIFPRVPIAGLIPDLAVEVISASNTRQEMDSKLREYFRLGVRLVWFVYPTTRQLHVYTAPDQHTVFGQEQTLDGGDVLPGFRLELKLLFAV